MYLYKYRTENTINELNVHEPGRMSVLTAHDSSNAGLLVVASGRVRHVRTKEDYWLVEHLWSNGRQEN